MANIKITQLPVGTSPLSGTEVVPIVQNGQTVQVPVSDIGATATPGYTAEDVANKTQDVSLDGTSTTKYPSAKATKDYADSLVVGLLDDRGSYVPSVTSPGPYPSTGGSGAGGAIEKGDIWFVASNGYIGTTAVSAGMSIRALSNAPGQTASNWDLIDYALGFTPENINNKITTAAQMSTFANSTVKYPAVKAVKDYIDAKPETLQEILDANHDLIYGINLQGTGAGDTMGGTLTDINAFGTDAAQGNQGYNVNALGNQAANLNQADDVNAFGQSAAKQNDGIGVNALGNGAALLNLGNSVNALGNGAASSNSGSNVIAIGDGAASNNTGTHVVALGNGAGTSNSFDNVVLLGNNASAQADNQIVHRNPTSGYSGTFDYNNLSDNRTVNFPDADGTPVMTVNGVAADAQGDVNITVPSTGWQLSGNAGTIPGTNFVGTTDNQDLVFKVNNNESLRLKASNKNLELAANINLVNSVGSAFLSYSSASNTYGSIGSNALGGFVELSANGSSYGTIRGNLLTSGRTYQMPDSDGTLALSVNGVAANASGNVVLPAPYKVWSARVQYVGTSLSIMQQLENTTGATITFSAAGGGAVAATASSTIFTSANKAFIMPSSYTGTASLYTVLGFFSSTTVMNIYSYNSANTIANESTKPFLLEIRIYP